VTAVRLVVTDLDGTLLDADTYDVSPARGALAALRDRGIPVVLCSSKSRAEMEPLAAALDLRAPLIVENGGAIVFPPGSSSSGAAHGDGSVLALGTPRPELLRALPDIAREVGVALRSFADMDPSEVSELTGLSDEGARLARRREWDEPFVVDESDAPRDLDTRLEEAARRRGLRVTRGGRLRHLTGPTDKGVAVRALLQVMPTGPAGVSVGLGDAANDLPMLRAVDHPVLVPRKRGGVDPVLVAALPAARTAPRPGPAGWAAAVMELLAGEPRAVGERR